VDSFILLLLAGVLVVAIVAFAGLGQLNKKHSGLDHRFYLEQWGKIEGFKGNGSAGLQLAIMEADKLLDHALKARGFAGDTMGDRLKSANKAFMNTQAIWDAHKLRNRLAHEQNVQLTGIAADGALRSLKAGLKDLGAM
jgi:hypothetical protein